MNSRKNKVVNNAVTGSCVGVLFGAPVGYLFSDSRLCSYIPQVFDNVLANSMGQITQQVSAVAITNTEALKEGVATFASSLGKFEILKNAGDKVFGAAQQVANQFPQSQYYFANIGKYLAKSIFASHPLLTGLPAIALDVSIGVVKTGLYTTCVEMMSPYKVIPISCAALALMGFGIGATIGFLRPEEKISEREIIKQSLLVSQSILNKKIPRSHSSPELNIILKK